MLPKVFKITGSGLARKCCKHHANERFYYSSKVLQIPCKLRGSCSIMLPKAYKMTDSSSSAANTMRKEGLVLAPRFGKSYANWQVQVPKCCEYKANSQYQDRNNEHLSKKIPKQFPLVQKDPETISDQPISHTLDFVTSVATQATFRVRTAHLLDFSMFSCSHCSSAKSVSIVATCFL